MMLLKSILLLCCLVMIQGAAVPAEDESFKPIIRVLNEKQLKQFLLENPNAQKLTPKVRAKKDIEIFGIYELDWNLGIRRAGDAAVYKTYSPQQWFGFAADPSLTVTYPKSGLGKIVTFVTVVVEQTSRFGAAYLLDGGINQRNIEFILYGINTHCYGWNITIYGKD